MPLKRLGLLQGFFAYVLWGLLPLYWKALSAFSAEVILAHRILWALVLTAGLVLALRQEKESLSVFKSPRKLVAMVGAAALISVNWWLYIWAVGHGFLVESALGYFINPLVSVVLGIVFLREKLSGWQTAAFALAAAGVLVMGWGIGHVPWIALGLAFSFGFYGLLKKQAPVPSLVSLQLETLFSSPLVLIFLLPAAGFWGNAQPEAWQIALLVIAGPVTVLPLWLFGSAARKITLAQIGFLQYVSPTLNLVIGVFVFQEHFDANKAVAFALIWCALVLFSVGEWRKRKAVKP
ncbi:MAG: EamA family transporter RarD [Spirochaetales bacterium]